MNTIDISSIDWARAQFALTAIYHWLFVPLTLGLAVIMGIMETCYYKTKKEFWKEAAKFWQKLFGVNFAMGVATGIILEFEFGTNWSNYSWFVGDIFGAPLAVEGIVAFFMESTFVAVMFFGWQKVSQGFHLTATWLSGLGATFSAWWILVANSWMQYPVGCAFNPETMRNEMVSFADVALSPFAVEKFCHTVTSSWIVGAVFTVAVSCYFLMKKKHEKLAKESIFIASIVGLVASLLAIHTGDESAYKVAKVQPMKLAAMEALYNGGEDAGLTLIAAVNPFAQPDYANEASAPLKIEVPNMLSILATHSVHGYVPGVNDIIKGYTNPTTGETELPLAEKIEKGKKAITALQTYRKLDKGSRTPEMKAEIMENMPYFGYGFIKEADQIVHFIPICFYAFRVMVGLGTLFLAFFAVCLFLVKKKDIADMKYLHWAGIALLPLAYVASECGWIVAEVGRQPWTIQDMLPTWAAVSNIASSEVMITFFLFLAIFTVLLITEISIMCKQIKKY
ncbi:MAG: cytochrome ubiquinol oxidase subunit I [Bacteroidaceae bacterium]|nr:cytochrome ubiquinol oxidase subunit I [Bacteroidaceae bacterium]